MSATANILTTHCGKCGCELHLEVPPGSDHELAADLTRLARLVICETCSTSHSPKIQPREARLPYADA